MKVNLAYGGTVHYLTFPNGAFHEEIILDLNPLFDYFILLVDPNFLFLSVNPSVSVATPVKIDQGETLLFRGHSHITSAAITRQGQSEC